jgi:uncharacterized protein (AIM24 family)
MVTEAVQTSVQPERTYTCTWCGTVSPGTSLSCPACGASVDVRTITTHSGWVKAPGQRDMARIQFGKSTCQIEGAYVPVVDYNLAPEDGIYFAHHVLLWQDSQVHVSVMSLKGAWKRVLSGMPVIMTQAKGPGRIAFSRDAPGEMIALPLQPGRAVDVREHVMLVATSTIDYGWFQTNVWFTTQNGDEKETHYPLGTFMDRFTASKDPGLLLLHASGNVFIRELAPHQQILIKPTALLYKDPTVQMNLHIEQPKVTWNAWSSWGERYLWLLLTGPGRVAVQSAFEPVEDNGRNITSHSYMTQSHW